ncbi:hypothetical protein DMUE_1955 [Dictyocoela muelleri]|nr:hypothetical protein DMUE_1955 [Dictyocoela muelleri]
MKEKKKISSTIKFSMGTLGLAILISLGLLFFIAWPQKPESVYLTKPELRSIIIANISSFIKKIQDKIYNSNSVIKSNFDALKSSIAHYTSFKIEDIKGYLESMSKEFIKNRDIFSQNDIDEIRQIIYNIRALEGRNIE